MLTGDAKHRKIRGGAGPLTTLQMSVKPHEAEGLPWNEEQRARIAQTLQRVCASAAFRNSKQCQKFIEHVVMNTLEGHEERLKERTIGVEVFGRPAAYDTSDDPVVRVRATEIRKRLAQYYQETGHEQDVKMDLPSGSYRVEFHFPAAPVAAEVAAGSRWGWLAGIVLLAVAVGVVIWMVPKRAPVTVVDQFWAPMLESTKPVLLYCGQPVVYFLSRDVHEAYANGLTPERTRGAKPLELKPDAVLHGRDIIPVTEMFVGIGNSHTAALLSALFAVKGKAVELRYANDLSFSELRSSPAVLIGAFSNSWTLEMTGQLRFVFEQEGGRRLIRDRQTQKKWTLEAQAPDGKTPEDYALVSRLFDAATGQPLMAAAGITQYGTRAAGEFLVDASRMEAALGRAGAEWKKKNVQVLLHTSVYKGTPARPEVLAVHVW